MVQEKKNKYNQGIFDDSIDATYIITMENGGREDNIQKQLDKMFGSYSPRTGRRTSPSGEASQALARNTFASLNNWWKTIEGQKRYYKKK